MLICQLRLIGEFGGHESGRGLVANPSPCPFASFSRAVEVQFRKPGPPNSANQKTEPIMFETQKSKWRALQTRNPLAASAFVYAVKTTGIYCRPTCPARLAREANVTFFDSATDAECAGFRACRRCKPSQSDFETKRTQHDKAVRKACKLMDAAGGRLTLENLAGCVGLSPRYFHGIFKNLMGVTPSVYAMGVRKEKAILTSLGGEKSSLSGRNEGKGAMLSGKSRSNTSLSRPPCISNC